MTPLMNLPKLLLLPLWQLQRKRTKILFSYICVYSYCKHDIAAILGVFSKNNEQHPFSLAKVQFTGQVIRPLKVYNWMIFSASTRLYSHHLFLVCDHFHCPKNDTNQTPLITPPSSLLPPVNVSQLLIYILSLFAYSRYFSYMHSYNQWPFVNFHLA